MWLFKFLFLLCSINFILSDDICSICGTIPVTARIFNGRPSIIGPSTVYLELNIGSSIHFCTGSIISSSSIITSAHCFLVNQILSPEDKAYTLSIYAGDVNKKGSESVLLEPKEVHLHPKFKYTTGDVNSFDDIAIIKLKNKIQFNNRIKPICLGIDAKVGDHSLVQGFGYKNFDDNSDKLLEANLIVKSDGQCKKIYNRFYTREHLCAINTANEPLTGACPGDSGGPLSILKNGRQYLVGLSSWGGHCDNYPNSPIVFSRVSSYLDWIKNITKTDLDCSKKKISKIRS